MQYGNRRISWIRNYIHTGRKRKSIGQKHGLTGTISSIQERWEARKLEEEEENYNKQKTWAARNHYGGIQSKLRMNKSANKIPIKKKDWGEWKGMKDALQRWEEWEA